MFNAPKGKEKARDVLTSDKRREAPDPTKKREGGMGGRRAGTVGAQLSALRTA